MFCPRSVFACSIRCWQQTTIISLHRIHWFVFLPQTGPSNLLLKASKNIFEPTICFQFLTQPHQSAPFPHNATHKAIICYYTDVLILYIPCIMYIHILPSFNQHLVRYISYTKSLCLPNTPTRFLLPEEGTKTPTKRVGILVKQRDVVYERNCIKCWFNEGEINILICLSVLSLQKLHIRVYCNDFSLTTITRDENTGFEWRSGCCTVGLS
jgi:hypothetical protein